MSILTTFGVGEQKLFSEGKPVQGVVTGVKECRWLKVNTKPVRTSGMDGAKFPHIVSFRYEVEGRQYTGSRYVSWSARCPNVQEQIAVYVDGTNPAKCAVKF